MRWTMIMLVASLVLASLAATTQAVVPYDEDTMTNYGHNGMYYTLATQPVEIPGGYRYVIDAFGVYMGGSQNHGIGGFDLDDLLNVWDLTEPPWNFSTGQPARWETMLFDFWASSTLDGTWDSPSYDMYGTNEWHENPNEPWGAPGHPVPGRLPEDYAPMAQSYHPVGIARAGEAYLTPLGGSYTAGEDFLNIANWAGGAPFSWNGGLLMTFVLDSSVAYSAGDLTWSQPGYGSGVDWADSVWFDHPDYVEGLGVDFDDNGTNDVFHESHGLYAILGGGFTWPGHLTTPGDFDDDGDVDSDDINDLCANITGSGNPANDPKYDLDGDGDTDQADMDMLIHDLVEISGGDGTGTEYGDFDLDGDVDTTDLTILATNFGVGTTWSEGNANCDLVIDTTDLAIMATNFGFVASGAVPEPMTMSLLVVGAAALLKRRR